MFLKNSSVYNLGKRGLMASEELVNWLKQNQASGYSLSDLKEKLLGGGYPAEEVEEAITTIMKSSSPKSTPLGAVTNDGNKGEEMKKKGKKVLWYLIGGVIILWALVAWIFWPRQFII